MGLRQKVQSSAYKSGFTIVELLIVIVIIAILAAIIIVAYNGITNKAHNSTVLSDMKNNNTKIMQTMVDSGAPPTANQAGLEGIVKFSKGSYLARPANDSLVYCRSDTDFGFIFASKSGQTYRTKNGAAPIALSTNWGGSSTNNACSSNTNVGMLIPNTDPGFAFIVLYGANTWVSWL